MNKNQRHLNHYGENLSSPGETEEALRRSLSKVAAKRTKCVTMRMIKDEDVYDLLRKIPAAKVSSYGDLAKALGNPSASRVIGLILGKNPNPIKVPCHRVVMSDGKVGGYAYGTAKKKELLEKEGVSFTNGIINDFRNVRVYP
jgi:methylated-DNA-[protein]-cysteine S-methyltransferase